MKSKFTWILTLALAFFIQFSFAQEKTITGKVVSKTDAMAIPGVNVLVQGTTRGVQTDFNGSYSIKAATGEKLVFSYLGFKSQTVTVGASTTVSIQLEDDDAQMLDAVVVQGYDVTKTRKTSNVSSQTVSAATIEARPNASFIQTLQGQVAGLNITTGTGQPGGNSTVIIRGVGSINGKVEPLYVIDGIPLNSDNFRSLNPDDIESVSVLKDAGATAIYGNRGANGVILVRTKKGGFDSGLKIKFNSTTSFTSLQDNKYNMMNAQQLLTLERSYGQGRGAVGGAAGGPMTDAEIAASPSTDWTDYFFRTGISQNQTLSLSSGSKNLSSFTPFGFLDQEGILKNTDLKRFNFRSNLSGKSNDDRFNYSTNVSINFSRRNEATSLGTGGINQNFVLGANNAAPYISPSDYTDSLTLQSDYANDGTLLLTPLMLIDKMKTFSNRIDELKALASFDGSYKLTKNLTFGSNLGIDYTQQNSQVYQAPTAFNSLLFLDQNGYLGFQSELFQQDIAISTTTRLNYNKTFADKHTINVAAYTEYFKANFKSISYTQNGLDGKVSGPGYGGGYILDNPDNDFFVPTVGSSKASTGLFSYFATADYDFDSKYGVEATVRRDASSRFALSNRWGTFFSVAGRWNIDRESFMEGSVFDALKLRASYGTNGNNDIVNSTYGALNRTRELYAIGAGYQGNPSTVIAQLAAPELKWETVTQANIGVDYELFNSRLRGTFDVYRKRTTDLFLDVPISFINATSVLTSNFGTMTNEGVEALLTYDILKSNSGLNISATFNGAFNENRVNTVSNESGLIDNGLTATAEDHVLNEFYLIRYAGVNPANGNLLFLDKDGNTTETPDTTDRVFTGKSSQPVWQGGFGLNADYKGFFLSSQFSYVADIYRLDYDLSGTRDRENIGIFNVSNDILRAWTPDNRITDQPSLNATNLSFDAESDRNLKDASYIRMRYVSFGYDVPKKMLENTFLKSVKGFVQAENLVTWSKWTGWDAESPRGNDQYQYPTPKIISVGLTVEF
ncbi:SusC/RagA family TonB-linked outer membrane protein [Flavobacterium tegetincola]|uniref:SusC/RagA family TonB-linked outer membrane protein n=1 Tax=Flavobacterium tegetincola TaxID=150172 RepID=UPI0004067ADA|nr:SusC/RagA family TonB-linked outer membrane protein [Flavobacterium tegetincola]